MTQATLQSAQKYFPWETSLCITGHRPEKLPQGVYLKYLEKVLYHYLDYAMMIGFTHFYIGLAEGIDYLSAMHLFHLRQNHPEIRVIGVQPCTDYESFFRIMHYDPAHLWQMKQQADEIIILSGSWKQKGTFLHRNCIMVEQCSAVLAVCQCSSHSGSMYTLHYAQRLGLAYCWIQSDCVPEFPAMPEKWAVERCGF